MKELYTKNTKLPTMSKTGGGANKNRFMPTAKPKNSKATLKRVIHLYLNCGKSIFLAMLLSALSSCISVTIPLFIGKAVNTFNLNLNTVNTSLLYGILIIILALYISNCLITTISSVLMLKVSQKLVHTLRSSFFDKMQKLPLSFYDTRSHGDTMSRLTNDVDNISSTIAQSTTQLITSILTISGSIIIMIYLNIWLTLVVLLCIPMVAILTMIITRKSRGYFFSQQKNLGDLNGLIEENIMGIKMVKAFNRQEDVLNAFSDINNNLYISSRKAQTWAGFMMPLMNVINNLIFALIAITGGLFSILYAMPIGTVVSFMSYSKQFSQPLNNIASMFNAIQSALAGAERVFEIMDEYQEPMDVENAISLQNPCGNVTFKDVSFSYNANKSILNNISFHVNAGETIALVGETGAGKTTIVNLITRFYDLDSGEILIDGVNIKNIKRSSLRNCFSIVLQDTCLFTGTIMDNIRYSSANATDEQVICAAKLSRAHNFIEKLPNGYNTMVYGNTDNISQGQRQLLAISRAILSNNPILILDEATSSVDTKTEKDIQKALLKLMKNKTSFLIAHRLSTIRDADRIMVIGDGEILESGTHTELMDKKCKYYQMIVSQMGSVEMPK